MLRVGILVAISELLGPWALTWQFCPVISCGRSELSLKGNDCVGSGLNRLYSTKCGGLRTSCRVGRGETLGHHSNTTPGRRILGRSVTGHLDMKVPGGMLALH